MSSYREGDPKPSRYRPYDDGSRNDETLQGNRIIKRAKFLMKYGFARGWSDAMAKATEDVGEYMKGR